MSMKPAEEWYHKYKVNADTCLSLPAIEAIQLDALKEGMRRAAEVADNRINHAVVPKITLAILTAAEQLTEKDL